jgi:hypothetical protein
VSGTGRYGLDERTQPHVRAAAEAVGGMFGVPTVLGYGQRANVSDHPKGLALDFMVGNDSGMGQSVANYLQRNAAALGVTYIIWRQRIWNVSRAAEGWRQMEDRGSRTANHYDHVHASFGPRAGSPTMPTLPDDQGVTKADPAVIAGLFDPLPGWFGDKLKDRVDEATAGAVHAVTGLVIAGVILVGGVALVVAGLARSAQSDKGNDDA